MHSNNMKKSYQDMKGIESIKTNLKVWLFLAHKVKAENEQLFSIDESAAKNQEEIAP